MELEQRVDEALFRRFISSSAIPLIGSALGSLLVVLSQLDSSKSYLFVDWLCLVYTTLVIRVWLTYRCKTQMAATGYNAQAAAKYAMTIALSGLAWGAGGLMVAESNPIATIIIITAIQSMVMGGVLTLGVFIPAFFAFTIPTILPMILVFAFGGGMTNFILAIYSAIFFVLMTCIARSFNQSLRDALRITFENEDLIASVTAANAKILIQNKELEHIAHHDALTGLPNRKLLADRMQQAMMRGQRRNMKIAVLFVDLDGFKPINDKLGHDAGDIALCEVSARLRAVMRKEDTLARVGGDEFVILLSDLNDNIKASVELVADKLLEVFLQSFSIYNQSFSMGASIGIAIGDDDASLDQLLIAADLAMYQAKQAGGGQYFWVKV